eukprot:5340041-Amphidinium_carterae.1
MRLSKVATTHGIGGVATTSEIWQLLIGLGGSSGLVDVTIIEHEMVPLLSPISYSVRHGFSRQCTTEATIQLRDQLGRSVEYQESDFSLLPCGCRFND